MGGWGGLEGESTEMYLNFTNNIIVCGCYSSKYNYILCMCCIFLDKPYLWGPFSIFVTLEKLKIVNNAIILVLANCVKSERI